MFGRRERRGEGFWQSHRSVLGQGAARPTVVLSNYTIAEDAANGTDVGTISTVNIPPDWGVSTYTIEVGGDPDNVFTITGGALDKDGTLDYEAATSHLVTITDTPSGPYAPIATTISIQVGNVAPVLSNATDTKTGQTTADITVDTTESNGTLYWVVTTSATPPTATQVRNGQDNSGVTATAHSTQAISTTGTKTVGVTGLTAATAYTAHFMHEETSGTQSNVASGNGFTTDSASDGNDANTVLLLHMDGADASTTFTDSAIGGAAPHTFTPNDNAQIDTAQSKFGGASGLFDGTLDWLTGDGSSDFAFGTGDFTIDFWLRLNTSLLYGLYDGRDGGAGAHPTLYLQGVLSFFVDSADRITGTTTLSTDTWYHVALARASGTTKLFVNGVQEGSSYADSNDYVNAANRPLIASLNGGQRLDGWIDELRVSNVARWTSNFTPPASAYS